MQQSEEV